jgi:hypothetical protein
MMSPLKDWRRMSKITKSGNRGKKNRRLHMQAVSLALLNILDCAPSQDQLKYLDKMLEVDQRDFGTYVNLCK